MFGQADPSASTPLRKAGASRLLRVLQVLTAVWLAFAVWVVGFRGGDEIVAVLPDAGQQFSLDLQVIGSMDSNPHGTGVGLVYAVEQRARPSYRIFSFDPTGGEIETVFTVPSDAIIYGIALSPDGSMLAVSYAADFNLAGNGVWLLDLRTEAFVEASPQTENVYLTELAWSPDGEAVFATRVDRAGEDEQLAVARVELVSGAVEVLVDDAIDPLVMGSDLYFLATDDARARHSIGFLAGSGDSGVAVTEIGVSGGELDLDHLLAGPSDGELWVAGIEAVDESALTLGQVAGAHGNHDVPSQWWDVTATTSAVIDGEPIIVYDAASVGGLIVEANLEGLAISWGDTRVDLIKSRAIRFVAA